MVREEGREEVSNERMRRERGREGGRDDERREGGMMRGLARRRLPDGTAGAIHH